MTSEDKTQYKEYNIRVTKTGNLELANTNLETLAIENVLVTPPFESYITHYNTQISNNITNLNILAVPENEKAKTQITGNNNLQEGNNKITITVTAANGITKRIYQINAYKRNMKEEEEYQKEQAEQAEKLEQAYEIEKLSNTNENENTKQLPKEKNKKYIITGITLIVIIVAIVGMICYRKRFLKEK